jgi:site-specific recombinase XerC
MTPLAPHLSAFLREHLPRERGASQHTIAAYAHCYRLLLTFAAERRKTRLISDNHPDRRRQPSWPQTLGEGRA